MRRIWRYLRARRFERDLAVEIEAHVDEMTDELMAGGMPPDRARTQAQRKFGNRTRLAEKCRERWAFAWLDEMGQDLRYAVRMLLRSPLFTMVAVFTLALGIAANTVIFSAVDGVLLRSLPYPRAERLFALWSRSASHAGEPMHVSAADFYDWQAQSRSFESLSAYASWPMNLTNVEEPRRLDTQLVSANFFSTLGVPAQAGRTFAPGEDEEKSAPVVVISHHLWRALGEPLELVGRTLTLNGSPATVIGVMPAGFDFPARETDAWAPLSPNSSNRANREGRWLKVVGRLAPRVQARDAVAEMDVISRQLSAAYPATNTGWSATLVALQEELAGKTRPILLTLQAGTLLLLLITCANLTSLLLAKGASRAREIGVRAALGAGRARILRQLIVESLVLAVLGGSLGLALAVQGMALLRTFGQDLIPRAAAIGLSGRVALFAIAATLATTLLFGIAPAWHGSRVDLRSQTASRATPRNLERRRGLLVAMEIGIACVLLIAAGLLGESWMRLVSTSPGLRTDHALTVRLTLSRSKYPTNAAQIAFLEQILELTRSLPGVVAASEISDAPLEGNNPTFEFAVAGFTRAPSDAPIQAGLRAIGSGYLHTAGIPLLKGREFTVDDRAGGLPVAIVNETMVRLYWPGSDPTGRTLRLKDDQRWLTIAGVAADVRHMGLKAGEGPVVYIPYAQKTQDWLAWTTLVVRTAGAPMDLVPQVRNAIRHLDKEQPVGDIGTLDGTLSRLVAIPRFTATIIGAVSGFALLIAVVGVYGLLVYTIAQRKPELGIRLTLGASPRHLTWLLLRQAILRVLAGIIGGMLGAWWLTRWLDSQLFGVRPHDTTTFITVAVVLVVVSMAAVLGPAHRATKIDASLALRSE